VEREWQSLMQTFSTERESKAEADKKVRELNQGNQSLVLTAKEVSTALTIREALTSHRKLHNFCLSMNRLPCHTAKLKEFRL
jgi:hypothetical protein